MYFVCCIRTIPSPYILARGPLSLFYGLTIIIILDSGVGQFMDINVYPAEKGCNLFYKIVYTQINLLSKEEITADQNPRCFLRFLKAE